MKNFRNLPFGKEDVFFCSGQACLSHSVFFKRNPDATGMPVGYGERRRSGFLWEGDGRKKSGIF